MLRQIGVLVLLSLKGLHRRVWQSLVIILGMACVSGVLLSLLSVTAGMERAYAIGADPANVIVISKGSREEESSAIPRDQARIILNVPGVAKAQDGSPLADANFVTSLPLPLKDNGVIAYARLSTFGSYGAALRPGFHLIAGRMFRPGTRELIAGPLLASQFKAMSLGDKVTMPDGQWPIVGIFSAGGVLDGDLVGDTETVLQAMQHKAYNSILLRLASPDSFSAMRTAISHNPLLNVEIMPLPNWNSRKSAERDAFNHVLIYGVSIILAVGAVLACFNTMYAVVESRAQEIATLRALGYSGFAVAFSVILEASLLAIIGALIGALIAWALYDGAQAGMGTDLFKLKVTPGMFGMAVYWAIAVSFLGGLLPSLRAARRSVVNALRAR